MLIQTHIRSECTCLGCVQAVSPDGEAIVTGAGDETLRFWNVFSKTRCTKVRLKCYIRTCSSSCTSTVTRFTFFSSVSRNPNQCWTCSPGYGNSQEVHPITWTNESLELALFCVLASTPVLPTERETLALPPLFFTEQISVYPIKIEWACCLC